MTNTFGFEPMNGYYVSSNNETLIIFAYTKNAARIEGSKKLSSKIISVKEI